MALQLFAVLTGQFLHRLSRKGGRAMLETLNAFLWGPGTLALILGTGAWLTLRRCPWGGMPGARASTAYPPSAP